MVNNDILRSMRYMLNLSDEGMVDIIKLVGLNVTSAEVKAWLKRDDDAMYQPCSNYVMAHFLNGLIVSRRGQKEDVTMVVETKPTINNNIVMKKLRVAFALKDTDLIDIYASVDFRVSKPELNAIFRHADHKNYRQCGDQLLRYFLKGLTLKMRGENCEN